MRFYHEVGSLVLGEKDGQYIKDLQPIAAQLEEPVTYLNANQLRTQYPYIANCSTAEAASNPNGGHISARNLVKAQQRLAEESGCDITHDVAERITLIGSGYYQVVLESNGDCFTGRKILLTTGAFTHARELLPFDLELKLELYGVTVLLVTNLLD